MKTKLIVLQNINKKLKMYYIPIFKLDSLISLVNEVNLEATSNGLSLQEMDSVHAYHLYHLI